MTDATTPLHIDRYFARIGGGHDGAPSLRALAGLLRAHMASLPFENLDVLLGRPIRLDLAGLQAKLVEARRGGYCFEHCTLLAAVLERLGYAVRRHAARVTLVAPWTDMPRTHMLLSVRLPEGRFVLDPGFGTHAPPFPVPLAAETDDEARARGATHWLAHDGRHWTLRVKGEGAAIACWVTTLEDEQPVDFVMANHYTSTWPASPFVNRLTLRAITPEGRVTVMNRDMKFWRGETPEPRVLADRAELRAVLAQHFGFDLPEAASLRIPAVPEWD